jgi:hypothetical protein
MVSLVYSALVQSGIKFSLMFSVFQQALVFLLGNVTRQVCWQSLLLGNKYGVRLYRKKKKE